MLIRVSFIKYIVIWSAVYWPLHAAGVRNGIAYALAFAAWVPAFEFFRRRRRRQFYDALVAREAAQADASEAVGPGPV